MRSRPSTTISRKGDTSGGAAGGFPHGEARRRNDVSDTTLRPPRGRACLRRSGAARGAVAVEFALVLPLLMALLLGIMETALAANRKLTLTHSAREGSRIAAIGAPVGPIDAPGSVKNRVRLASPGLEIDDDQIALDWSPDGGAAWNPLTDADSTALIPPGRLIRVRVSHPYALASGSFFAGILSNPLPLQASMVSAKE